MEVSNDIYFALVEERIAEGQPVTITLRGTSMQPTLCTGDTLLLEPVTLPLEPGDIVLFRYRGRHLLHRIVAMTDGRIALRGDNCENCEECELSDVVARMRKVVKKARMRHALVWCTGPRGLRRLRHLYFALLAFLMWAPLNGVGIPLNNYVFGLRTDHLLHASVFVPCVFFLWGVVKPGWMSWLTAVGIGVLTESVQYLLPYRGFDINDMIANFLGVTLGWGAIVLCRQAVRRRRRYPRHGKREGYTSRRVD